MRPNPEESFMPASSWLSLRPHTPLPLEWHTPASWLIPIGITELAYKVCNGFPIKLAHW